MHADLIFCGSTRIVKIVCIFGDVWALCWLVCSSSTLLRVGGHHSNWAVGIILPDAKFVDLLRVSLGSTSIPCWKNANVLF